MSYPHIPIIHKEKEKKKQKKKEKGYGYSSLKVTFLYCTKGDISKLR